VALATEKLTPLERNEKLVVVGVTHPGVGGPQIVKVPLTAFEGSTVTLMSLTPTPTWFDCCAYWSGFEGSIVDTVTTFEVRLIAKIGTGTALSGAEIAVKEEILALCPNAEGAANKSSMQIKFRAL
jgi:hypothetical protein